MDQSRAKGYTEFLECMGSHTMTAELRATANETWNRDAASLEGLSLAIGSTTLLKDATMSISRGDRITLLGRNGCGKSTLSHWIAGRKTPWSIYEVAQELAPTTMSVVGVVLGAHLERGRLWNRQAELEGIEEMTDVEF